MVDLHSYDQVAISLSGGKDSWAALKMVMAQVEAQDYPRSQVVAIHADLGRAEWKGTAELVRRHADWFGIELMLCEREEDLFDHVRSRGMWMGRAQKLRYCTADHKTAQIHKVYTKLADHWRFSLNYPVQRPFRILEVLGLRAAESGKRKKQPAFGRNHRASNKTRRTVDTWLPVKWYSNAQVEPFKATSGHPAYAAGLPRASCVFCVFADKGALMLAGKANPELLDTAIAIEEEIDHTFTKELSLAQVREGIRTGEPITTASFGCGL